MQQDYIFRASQIIHTIHYAVVATASKEGIPWNSPVSYICNDTGELYWFSNKDSTHSRNIRENNRVCIVIFDSTAPPGKGRGVYIDARAYELEDPLEVHKARSYVAEDIRLTPEHFLGTASRRAYKAIPRAIWTNETVRTNGILQKDYRISLPLSCLTTEVQASTC